MIALDSTIIDLYNSGLFRSVRAYNCCRAWGFNSVLELLTYYDENKSFMSLRNCGKKTNIELTELCLTLLYWGVKVVDQVETKKEADDENIENNNVKVKFEDNQNFVFANGYHLDTTLDQLYKDGYLQSIRCVNSCYNSRIYTLYDLLEYYRSNGTFMRIHNLGKKSDSELLEFVSSIIGEYEDRIKHFLEGKDQIDGIVAPTSSVDKKDLEKIVLEYCANDAHDVSLFKGFVSSDGVFNFNNRFGITSVFLFHDFAGFLFSYLQKENPNLRKFKKVLDSIELYRASFPSMLIDAVIIMDAEARSYIDVKCNMLIPKKYASFHLDGINDLLEFCFSLDKKNGKEELLKVVLKNKMQQLYETICILNRDGKSFMIKDLADSIGIYGCDYKFVVDYLLENKKLPLFYLLECYCKSVLHEYQTNAKNLVPLVVKRGAVCATYFGLGVKTVCSMEDASRIFNVTRQTVQNYIRGGILKYSGLDCYDWDECYGCEFGLDSSLFRTKESIVQSIIENELLASKPEAISKVLSAISNHVFYEYNGSQYVLDIKKTDWKQLGIDKSIKTIISIVDKKRIKDEVLVIKDMLPGNLGEKQICYLIDFVGFILNNNNNCSAHEGRLILYKNGCKNMSDLAEEVLRENGTLMRAEEILSKALEKEPSHKVVTVTQLKHFLFANENIVSIGKTGWYALKEWGTETKTIRSCAIEFLKTKEEPQRIEKILEYVNRFYPHVSLHSLDTSLKLDKSVAFVGNCSFALTDKIYKFRKTNISYSIYKLLENLENFIQKNHAFPAGLSMDKEEEDLHDLWYSVVEQLGELSHDDRNAINEFKEKYSQYIPED